MWFSVCAAIAAQTENHIPFPQHSNAPFDGGVYIQIYIFWLYLDTWIFKPDPDILIMVPYTDTILFEWGCIGHWKTYHYAGNF